MATCYRSSECHGADSGPEAQGEGSDPSSPAPHTHTHAVIRAHISDPSSNVVSEVIFHDAGLFYWVDVASFMKSPDLISDKMASFKIGKYDSQDIDTPEDWDRAEYSYHYIESKKN